MREKNQSYVKLIQIWWTNNQDQYQLSYLIFDAIDADCSVNREIEHCKLHKSTDWFLILILLWFQKFRKTKKPVGFKRCQIKQNLKVNNCNASYIEFVLKCFISWIKYTTN